MGVEACDDGANTGVEGSSDCLPGCGATNVCGDSHTGTTEDCDDAGESASCDANCTLATCGDTTVNGTAGEECDDGTATAVCTDQCTNSSCGDGIVNAAAGEVCDVAVPDGCEAVTSNLLAEGEVVCAGDCLSGTFSDCNTVQPYWPIAGGITDFVEVPPGALRFSDIPDGVPCPSNVGNSDVGSCGYAGLTVVWRTSEITSCEGKAAGDSLNALSWSCTEISGGVELVGEPGISVRNALEALIDVSVPGAPAWAAGSVSVVSLTDFTTVLAESATSPWFDAPLVAWDGAANPLAPFASGAAPVVVADGSASCAVEVVLDAPGVFLVPGTTAIESVEIVGEGVVFAGRLTGPTTLPVGTPTINVHDTREVIVSGTVDRAGAPSVRVQGSAEQILVSALDGVDVNCSAECLPGAAPTVEVVGDPATMSAVAIRGVSDTASYDLFDPSPLGASVEISMSSMATDGVRRFSLENSDATRCMRATNVSFSSFRELTIGGGCSLELVGSLSNRFSLGASNFPITQLGDTLADHLERYHGGDGLTVHENAIATRLASLLGTSPTRGLSGRRPSSRVPWCWARPCVGQSLSRILSRGLRWACRSHRAIRIQCSWRGCGLRKYGPRRSCSRATLSSRTQPSQAWMTRRRRLRWWIFRSRIRRSTPSFGGNCTCSMRWTIWGRSATWGPVRSRGWLARPLILDRECPAIASPRTVR